jgi:hypothetical protein
MAGARNPSMAARSEPCVSPEKVGEEAHSPQPVRPASVSIRTTTFWAVATSEPAMRTGFASGSDTGIASTRSIFMALALRRKSRPTEVSPP